EPVEPELHKVLNLFFDMSKSEVTNDDIFGTKERKQIGDSWPLNTEMAAKSAEEEEITIDPKDIEGQVTLEKRVEVDGVPCLLIRGKANISKAQIPMPGDVKIEKSHVTAELSGEFPVDVSKGLVSQKKRVTMSMEAKGTPEPGAPEITLVVKGEESVETRRKVLK
ncbi:MAG: hypothetical protein ACYS47_15290, partial [Planctomycetota bacterium]